MRLCWEVQRCKATMADWDLGYESKSGSELLMVRAMMQYCPHNWHQGDSRQEKPGWTWGCHIYISMFICEGVLLNGLANTLQHQMNKLNAKETHRSGNNIPNLSIPLDGNTAFLCYRRTWCPRDRLPHVISRDVLLIQLLVTNYSLCDKSWIGETQAWPFYPLATVYSPLESGMFVLLVISQYARHNSCQSSAFPKMLQILKYVCDL